METVIALSSDQITTENKISRSIHYRPGVGTRDTSSDGNRFFLLFFLFQWMILVVLLLKGIKKKSMLLNPACHAGSVLHHRIGKPPKVQSTKRYKKKVQSDCK